MRNAHSNLIKLNLIKVLMTQRYQIFKGVRLSCLIWLLKVCTSTYLQLCVFVFVKQRSKRSQFNSASMHFAYSSRLENQGMSVQNAYQNTQSVRTANNVKHAQSAQFKMVQSKQESLLKILIFNMQIMKLCIKYPFMADALAFIEHGHHMHAYPYCYNRCSFRIMMPVGSVERFGENPHI